MASYQSAYTGPQIDTAIGKVSAIGAKSVATQEQIAAIETSYTSSRAYAAGECFCLNGNLYQCTSPISSGGTITPNTNCVQVTATQKPGAVLLWTNSTPNADFTAQTIVSSALSPFSMVMLVYKYYKEDTAFGTDVVPVDGQIHVFSATRLSSVGNSAAFMYRTGTVSKNSGIAFSGGHRGILPDGEATDNDGCIIPYRVYGIF